MSIRSFQFSPGECDGGVTAVVGGESGWGACLSSPAVPPLLAFAVMAGGIPPEAMHLWLERHPPWLIESLGRGVWFQSLHFSA